MYDYGSIDEAIIIHIGAAIYDDEPLAHPAASTVSDQVRPHPDVRSGGLVTDDTRPTMTFLLKNLRTSQAFQTCYRISTTWMACLKTSTLACTMRQSTKTSPRRGILPEPTVLLNVISNQTNCLLLQD